MRRYLAQLWSIFAEAFLFTLSWCLVALIAWPWIRSIFKGLTITLIID